MRLKEIFIDGYGVFFDFVLKDLSPGFNLIYGPNEAGKTTLIHFINCILFGFSNRNSADFHPPLRGGVHGGRVVVFSEKAGELIISRHTTKRIYAPPVVKTAQGDTLDEKTYHSLVGNISKDSYRQYFSFGLDELQGLEEEGLQSQLYSAGYTGRGRSIPEVEKLLADRMGQLWKPTGTKNELRQLFDQLEDLEKKIQELQKQPEEYQGLLQEREEAQETLNHVQDRLERVNRERIFVQNLSQLWPSWIKLQEIRAQIEQLADEAKTGEALRNYQDRITGLYLGLDHFWSYLSDYEQARQDHVTARNQVEKSLTMLGSDWTKEKVRAFPNDVVSEQRIRGKAQKLQQAREDLHSAWESLQRQKERLVELQQPIQQLEEELAELGELPQSAELATLRAAVIEAERLSAEKDRLQGELVLIQREKQYLEDRMAVGSSSWSWKGFGLIPWAILIITGAVFFFLGSLPSVSISLLAIGGVGLAYAFYQRGLGAGQNARRQSLEVSQKLADLESQERNLENRAAEAKERLMQIGEMFSLETEEFGSQELVEIKERLGRMEERERIHREGKRARANLRQGEELLQQKEAIWEKAQGYLQQVELEWQEYLSELGIRSDLDIEGVYSLLNSIRSARQDLEREEEALRAVRQAEQRLVKLKEELNPLLQLIQEEEIRDYSAIPEAVNLCYQKLSRVLEYSSLVDEKNRLVGSMAVRLGVESDYCQLQEIFTRRDEAETQRAVEKWEKEYSDLAQQRDSLNELLGALQAKLERLEGDDALIDLQLEYNLKIEQAQRLALEWASYALTKHALDKAKERYEQEKQPEIMAKASGYFNKVTTGRYQRVIKPVDQVGVLVEDSDRNRIRPENLSRGTIEQLYLCLRLALAEKFSGDSEPLPLIMDDVLVNLDQMRFEEACALLGEVAQNQQIFYFTCHQEVVSYFLNLGLDKVIQLEDGQLSRAPLTQGELPFSS